MLQDYEEERLPVVKKRRKTKREELHVDADLLMLKVKMS